MEERKIKRWEDCAREDLNMIPKMIAAGWQPVFDYRDMRHGRLTPDNPPHDGVGFRNGIVHAWKGYKGGFSHWVVADLIEGHYCNHRQVSDLNELIEKEAT